MPSEKSPGLDMAVIAYPDKREFLSDGLGILIWMRGISRPLRTSRVFEAAAAAWQIGLAIPRPANPLHTARYPRGGRTAPVRPRDWRCAARDRAFAIVPAHSWPLPNARPAHSSPRRCATRSGNR